MELELDERTAVPLSLESLQDLIEWWGDGHEPGMSPPLCLGWDIHRQWPSEGFALWRDLMLDYEPPFLAAELLEGDQRKAVTLEQYDAALVEQWGRFAREKRGFDDLIVDVMHSARSAGWEVCGSASQATEAILDDLAARSGAKRAAIDAVERAASDRWDARAERYWALDEAAYDAWLDAGASDGPKARVDRWKARRAAEDEAIAAYDARRAEQVAMRDAAQAEWLAFGGVATQAQIDALKEKYKHLMLPFERTLEPVTIHPFPKPAAPEPTGIRPRRIDAASLEGKPVPDREWLVRDLIPAKNVTLLYGDGGTGKSLLALQLGAAVVTGRPFFTHMVKQGRVEFVTAEDSLDEMHRRLVDIAPLGSLSGFHLTSLAETDAMLAVAPDSRGGALAVTALYNELESVIAESRPVLVVLDTLADVFGGNEIIRAQARQFIGMLRRLCLQYDCTIVVLAHPSLAGMEKGTSGSTGWNNSVRSRLYFGRVHESDGSESDEDARMLRLGKSNYGRVGLEIPMRWRAGVFVAEGGAASGDPIVTAAKAERVFLELLDKANDRNSHVSGSLKANNYAPKVFARDALKQRVRKSDLIDIMDRLITSKKIENAPYGSPSRMHYRLQRIYVPAQPAPPL